jgi:MoxR-like ATPase
LFEARTAARNLYLADNLEEYIVQLTQAPRQPEYYSRELASWLEYGVSPRATIALDACARAHAFLNGQEYVTPDNIQSVLPDIFRHRLLLSYDAQAQGVDAEQVIKKILQVVPVP